MRNVSTLASQNILQMTLRAGARHPVETYRFFIAASDDIRPVEGPCLDNRDSRRLSHSLAALVRADEFPDTAPDRFRGDCRHDEPVRPRRLQEAPVGSHVQQMRRVAFILLVGLVAQSVAASAQESRWGAFALGGNGFGATRGRPDEASATSGALRQCEESGGASECRIRLTYRNQCAAYAAGEDRQVGVAYAGTIEKAGKLARRSCSEAAKNCRIHYAACSVPGSRSRNACANTISCGDVTLAQNGMSERFMKTVKRDYAGLRFCQRQHDPCQIARLDRDYCEVHPHSGLKFRSLREFIRLSA